MDANPSCPAGCPGDVVGLLAGPHRVGARLVMILPSHQHWPPAAIAEFDGRHGWGLLTDTSGGKFSSAATTVTEFVAAHTR